MNVRSFINIQKEDNYEKANLKIYQQLVGKLIYFLCSTRPDITFVVGQLNKYNSDIKIGHLKMAKQVICYLKVIMHFRIKYGNIFNLINRLRH